MKITKQEERRKIIISKYLENKNASINSIAKELKFPPSTVKTVINRFNQTFTTLRKTGSGRKKGFANPSKAQKVARYAQKNPDASLRNIALKFKVGKTWVADVLSAFDLKAYKVQKNANRNDQQAANAKKRARKLYDDFLSKVKRCTCMDDETYVVADFQQLPGRSFYCAFKRFAVASCFKYQRLSKFPRKFMVWQAICSCGKRSRC